MIHIKGDSVAWPLDKDDILNSKEVRRFFAYFCTTFFLHFFARPGVFYYKDEGRGKSNTKSDYISVCDPSLLLLGSYKKLLIFAIRKRGTGKLVHIPV